MIKNIPHLRKSSWLNQAALAVTSVLAVAAGLILASAMFAILLVVGLIAGSWLWWRFHQWARQAQQAAPEIIEGEYTVEPMSPLLENHRTSSSLLQKQGTRRRSR